MALHRWPTDPPGKSPSHTISWNEHQVSMAKDVRERQKASGTFTNPALPVGNNPLKGPSGGAAPAAAAGPPVDPVLDGLVAGIQSGRDTKVGQLEAQRPQVLADYGYKATGYDATGAATGLAFDPNNTYSKAALLLRNYNQQQSGTKNSMAARGQLFSGAFARGKRENEFGYGRNEDALKKALTGALTGIASGIAGVKTQANTDISQARLNRAPQP